MYLNVMPLRAKTTDVSGRFVTSHSYRYTPHEDSCDENGTKIVDIGVSGPCAKQPRHTPRHHVATYLLTPAKAGGSCRKRMHVWPEIPAFAGMMIYVSWSVQLLGTSENRMRIMMLQGRERIYAGKAGLRKGIGRKKGAGDIARPVASVRVRRKRMNAMALAMRP